MPTIPSYSESLGEETLGPGITILGGNIFTDKHENEDQSTLSIAQINNELAQGASFDNIEFLPDEEPHDKLLEKFKESNS